MQYCDVCGATATGDTKRYSAVQFRVAVRAGLRPPRSMFDGSVGARAGASFRDWEAGWIAMAMQDTTDWIACKACTFKVDDAITANGSKQGSDEKTLEAEADSLEEARETVRAQIPEDLDVLAEEVISDGTMKTQTGVGESVEAAFQQALERLPAGAGVHEKRTILEPAEKTLDVSAFDTKSANLAAKRQMTENQSIHSINLKVAGKKGLWGIGRKPSIFEVTFRQGAVVEVDHVTKPKVRVTIGRKPYEFKNRRFYSGRSVSELLGVIVLTPVFQAELIASSNTFIGVVEDTVGERFDRIMKKCKIFSIAHHQTESLFGKSALASSRGEAALEAARQEIIQTAVQACRTNTNGMFPPEPVMKHYYHIGAIPTNEKTKSCFLVVAVYKE